MAWNRERAHAWTTQAGPAHISNVELLDANRRLHQAVYGTDLAAPAVPPPYTGKRTGTYP